MLPQVLRRCVVIGESQLCVACAEELIRRHWKIDFIVTTDSKVQEWAVANKISCIEFKEYANQQNDVSYLFSIVNKHIILPDKLSEVSQLAINYHNSLLPKYAGSNSVTWSILSNEKNHGITWHCISDKVDCGDILHQAQIPISRDDTAISLNIKCAQLGAQKFSALLDDLESGTLIPKKQKSLKGSFYKENAIPSNFGCLTFTESIKVLDQLKKALDYEGHYNPVTAFKLKTENTFAIIEKCKLEKTRTNHHPGKILKQTKHELIISLKDGLIHLYSLRTPSGKHLNLSNFSLSHSPYPNIKNKTTLVRDSYYRKHLESFGAPLSNYKKLKPTLLEFSVSDIGDIKPNTVAACIMAFFIKTLPTAQRSISFNYVTEKSHNDHVQNPLLSGVLPYTLDTMEVTNSSTSQIADDLTNYLADYNPMQCDLYYRHRIHEEEWRRSITILFTNTSNIELENISGLSFLIQDNIISLVARIDLPSGCLHSIKEGVQTIFSQHRNIHGPVLKALAILSSSTLNKILYEWSSTSRMIMTLLPLHNQFEHQALKTPNSKALSHKGTGLSYYQLNKIANSIAHKILEIKQNKRSLVEDSIIGVLVKPGNDLVACMLGILKSNAAFFLIDNDMPEKRLEEILLQSKISAILTTGKISINLLETIRQFEIATLDISTIDINNVNTANPNLPSNKRHLAYCIFTSGTTGTPKMVKIEHKSLINTISALNCLLELKPNINVLQFSSVYFDVFVSEVFTTLSTGACLHIIDADLKNDIKNLEKYIISNNIKCIPGLPASMLEYLTDKIASMVELVIIGGETASEKSINEWCQKLKLVNAYGPTETTICASYHVYKNGDSANNIGSPIQNSHIYILNEQLQPQPIGFEGDIYIAGEGLARLPADTNDIRFLPSPFSRNSNDLMYKTGDSARWLPNGELIFLGRKDEQIKIRGFRIDPHEIEAAIEKNIEVIKSVVNPLLHNNNEYLIAYYMKRPNTLIDKSKIQDQLYQYLPKYMLPSFFIELTDFPLTQNGKINKKALPLPQELFTTTTSYDDKLMKKVAELWEEVLNAKPSDKDNNFFSLGGHSLLAIKLIDCIEKKFSIIMPISSLYQHCTLESMTEYLRRNEAECTPVSIIKKIKKKNYYDASFSQNRLYTINTTLESKVALYNVPLILNLHSSINDDDIHTLINGLLTLHESLRTYFILDKASLKQIISNNFTLEIKSYLASHGAKEIEKEISKQLSIPFSMDNPQLLRAFLFKTASDYNVLCLIFHHSIVDGVSLNIILNTLNLLHKKTILTHDSENYTFKDYVYFFKENLKKVRLKALEKYWHSRLKNYYTIVNFPYDNPLRSESDDYSGDTITHKLSKDQFIKIKEYCLENSLTVQNFLFGVFSLVLSKYADQTNLVIGLPVSGRTRSEFNSIVGMLTNTLCLAFPVNQNISISEYFNEISLTMFDALSHQDYPYDYLVQHMRMNSKSFHSNLFDLFFSYQIFEGSSTDPINIYENWPNIKQKTAKFNLSLNITEIRQYEIIYLSFEYRNGLFESSTINRLYDNIIFTALQAIQNPGVMVKDFNILSPKEEAELFRMGRPSSTIRPNENSIITFFEKQVKQTPLSTAIVYGNEKISYRDLNESANILAKYLDQQYGSIVSESPNKVVALYSERNIEAIIILLAILKMGFAYLPVSTEYPEKQLEYIINDSQAPLIITNFSLNDPLNSLNKKTHILSFDKIRKHLAKHKDKPTHISSNINIKTDTAYIVYTSGTTGKPKGVTVKQHSLISVIRSLQDIYQIEPSSIGTQFASLSFDVFASEVFTLLCKGATLHILSNKIKRDPAVLTDYINANKISVIPFMPPAILESLSPSYVSDSLKLMAVGGDKCHQDCIDKWSRKVILINVYGPTETTIWSTTYNYQPGDSNNIIGRPIDNNFTYVLDKQKKLCPFGVLGELYISGNNVSAGYLNKIELTSAKFIPDPFNTDASGKHYVMYATGDLARWNSRSQLQFYGRGDFQVKVRGHRVELSAIETVLEKHPAVKKAAVIFYTGETDNLIAFFTTNKKISAEKIAEYITTYLPSYMIPDNFIPIKDIPTDLNGKINRSILKEKYLNSLGNKTQNTITSNNIYEDCLINLYKSLLNEKNIDRNSDFFSLGGNSLKAIQLSRLFTDQCHIDLPVDLIFKHPKISTLLPVVVNKKASQHIPIQTIPNTDEYPASSIQSSFYLHQKVVGDSTPVYNIPYCVHLESNSTTLKDKLEKIINAIIVQNEILRTSFKVKADKLIQIIHSEIKFTLEELKEYKKDTKSINNLISTIIKIPFDSSHAPLFRGYLLKVSKNEYLLMLNFHHIIVDAMSIKQFVKLIGMMYFDSILPKAKIQYKDFCAYQTNMLSQSTWHTKKCFWITLFEPDLLPLELPSDRPRTSLKKFYGTEYEFKINEQLHNKIVNFCRKSRLTEHTFLFATFYLLLKHLSHQTDIVIGVPVLGRNHPDLSDSIGLFINILPIRISHSGDATICDFINYINNQLQSTYMNQEIPLEEITRLVKAKRSSSRNPLFDVLFSYQIMEDDKTTNPECFKPYHLDCSVIDSGLARFDLSCFVDSYKPNELTINFQYSTELFKEQTIIKFSEVYLEIIRSLTELETNSTLLSCRLDDLTKNLVKFKLHSKISNSIESSLDITTTDNPEITNINQALNSIWQQVLELENTSLQRTSNFFDLGGNSLSCMYMLDLVTTRYPNTVISLQQFQENSTLENLLQQINRCIQHSEVKVSRRILSLKAGSNLSPIFVLPGFIGFGSGYSELALALKTPSAIYGIQMEGLFPGEKPLNNIYDIASSNLNLIQSHITKGHFNLIAHSFGAAVAFEMIHQLEQRTFDIQLENIVFLDSGPHCMLINQVPLTKLDHAKALFSILNFLLPDDLVEDLFMSNVSNVKQFLDTTTEQKTPESAINFAVDFAQKHGVTLNHEHLMNTYNVALTNAGIQYKPKSIVNNNIHLIRAFDDDTRIYTHHNLDSCEFDLGWSKYTNGTVVPILSSGNHISMIKSPHLERTAKIIDTLFSKTRGVDD